MAFKGNPFALLKDDDDGDVSSLLSPVSNASESKLSAEPQLVVGYEGGRGIGRDSGFGRNSGTNVESLGHSQQNGMQKNQERVNNYRPSNDYRRYNGYSNGYRQHGGRTNGHQQQSRRNNGYRKNDVPDPSNENDGTEKGQWHAVGGGSGKRFDENNGFTKGHYNGHSGRYRLQRGRDNGYRKNDVPEQNNATDSTKPYSRDSSSNNDDEAEKGQLHRIGENRGRRFDENNGFMEWKVTTGGDSKEGEANQNGQEVPTGNNSEEGIKEKKKDIRMTLKEYEKQLLQKRKALEALKLDERKVTLDKDLESMQLVGKKKHSEKEKLKKDVNRMDDKPQKVKHVNLGMDDKLQKDCNAIMRAWYGGHGVQGGRYRGFSWAATTRREGETPQIAHSNEIPVQTPHVD